MLTITACSSDPSTGGGSSGSGNTTAGASATGGRPAGGGSGVAGSPSTGGGGAGTVGGASGNTAGAASTAGAPGTGGASAGGASAGGSSAGGASAGGSSTGGSVGTGGSGPAATFKCDNLSLAPSTTGVAKPAGAAGGLKVIDWAGFKGAVSFTFDDNTPSQLANYTALKATGAHFTWFLIASSAGTGYKATIADGQEIANHTQTHPQGASAGEVSNAQTTLKSNYGVDVHSMAAPNCADAWKAFAAPAKLFQNRGPCGSGIATVGPRDSTDPFLLPAYLPAAGEASATMSGSIQAGKWRIFVIHGFDSQNGTYQPVPIANVTGSMTKAVSDGYWVEGMTNIGSYWQGQKLIPASATTSATWTLPANFPQNQCVRITTTGGTVTQKGETIGWDAHGYYQISLDAGEVTIK
ncbi:MAG: polysaccharide deacetylase family protein [Polyangiaceae bacterium]